MPKFFIKGKQLNEETINITGNDVNHIKNVLRKRVGDTITICNQSNMVDFLCEISNISDENIECKIKERLKENVESNIHVTIIQGLPKADKMELVIQKSVELGAYDLTPIEMKRCVVKLNDKDKNKKIERWQIISEVAAKQCGRNIIPNINPIINIKNICNLLDEYDIVLVAYEKEKERTIKEELKKIKQLYNKDQIIKIAIIIGPEGGISEEEINLLKENGAKSISLGKRILRTETVALNLLSIVLYELDM